MNWGGFADGFSRGFNNGMAMGKAFKQAMKEKAVEDATKSGMADANAKRDAYISAAVREQGIPQATDATPATGQPAQGAAQPAGGYPAAEDPMTADRVQAPPVDASLQGAPAPAAPQPAQQPAPQAPATPMASSAPPAAQEPATTAATGAAAAAASGLPGANRKTRFMVGDRAFDTRDEALAHAKESAPSVMDFMAKTLVPKMQQAYLEQGDIEKAEAWGKWAKERENARHMENWAKAFKAYQSGDFVASAKHLVSLHGDFPDGNSIVAADPVKDKKGNVTGFNMKVKNDQTGETRAQFVDPKTLTEYGLGALSPDKMFNAVYQRQSQADALAAKARIDAQNDARTLNRDIVKQTMIEDRADKRAEAADRRRAASDERQHGYKLEEMATEADMKIKGMSAQEKAKVQGKIDILKENGLPPNVIRELIPHMVGGDGYKKSTSPEEARRLLLTERVKDPLFASKKPAEQKAIIDQDMQTIYGPAVGGQDKPQGAKPPAAPQYYRDKETGQVMMMQDGKLVPVPGPAPQTAPPPRRGGASGDW